MIRLSIFTPTYNRENLLHQLYESLCGQTCKEFVWIIVDDGSKDRTAEIVKGWIAENRLQIKYIYQENKGKSQAHNMGVLYCETELFCCVDSDDYLVDDAVEIILRTWDGVSDNSRIGGIVSPRKMNRCLGFQNNIPPQGTLGALYQRYGFKGETLLVFRTEILKGCLFPYVEGECFMKENVVYWQIDRKYELCYLNEFLCCGEYLADGLTTQGARREQNNPVSTLIYYQMGAKYAGTMGLRLKYAGCYYAWKKHFSMDSAPQDIRLGLVEAVAGKMLSLHYLKLFRQKYRL